MPNSPPPPLPLCLPPPDGLLLVAVVDDFDPAEVLFLATPPDVRDLVVLLDFFFAPLLKFF